MHNTLIILNNHITAKYIKGWSESLINPEKIIRYLIETQISDNYAAKFIAHLPVNSSDSSKRMEYIFLA